MRLPEIAVRRPVTTVMVFAGIALLGTVAFFRTNLDMLPDISPPAISVITTYPGASATDVESEVTKYSRTSSRRCPVWSAWSPCPRTTSRSSIAFSTGV